jgi:hypothetical protein
MECRTDHFDSPCLIIKPVQMLSALSQDAAWFQIAKEVEDNTIQMADEAKSKFTT